MQAEQHARELEAQRRFHKESVGKLTNFSKYCDDQEKRRQSALRVVQAATKQCAVKKRLKTVFDAVVKGDGLSTNKQALRMEMCAVP